MFSSIATDGLWAGRGRRCAFSSRVAILALLWLGAGFGAARAASFEVGPVLIKLSAQHPVAVEEVRNDSDTPVTIQVSVAAWEQSEDADRYLPTRDLVATPPIFTLAPAGRQIVRVASRLAWPLLQERSYRMFLQQVPSGRAPGERTVLQVLLRLGVPVFVEPQSGVVAPRLVWSAQATAHGLTVRVDNQGSGHARINSLTVYDGSRHRLAQGPVGFYVLPGHARSFTLTSNRAVKPGMRLHVKAQTDAGQVSADAVVAR